MQIPEHIKEFWQCFLDSPSCPESADHLFLETFRIGSSAESADEGAALVLSGLKTATSSLLWEIENSAAPMPYEGALSVLEDGRNKPVCVVQTTWVKIVSFDEVDTGFARDYSETDGSLGEWRRVFGAYYATLCESIGHRFSGETPLVCERFKVIFPVPRK